MAESDVVGKLLEGQMWSGSTREDIIRVVERSERENGHRRFHLVAGEPDGDCRIQLVHVRVKAVRCPAWEK